MATNATHYQVLSLTQLKRSVRRAILGKVEHAGTRFIITDYGEAVAELGPLSSSAAVFLSQLETHNGHLAELDDSTDEKHEEAGLE